MTFKLSLEFSQILHQITRIKNWLKVGSLYHITFLLEAMEYSRKSPDQNE